MVNQSHARGGLPQSNHTDIWQRALQLLRDTLEGKVYETYLQDTHALEIRGGILHIGVPKPINLQTLKSTYHGRIQEAVRHSAQRPMEIEYRVAAKPEPTPIGLGRDDGSSMFSSSRGGQGKRSTVGEGERYFPVLRRDTTFERFIVGEANRIAHAGAMRVAHQPGDDMNPLFVHAPTGQGKTHLLEAIAHHTMHGYRVVYVNAEDYIRGFVDSAIHGSRAEFQDRFENAEILIVDDIQKLKRADGTQEEFFNLFNALISRDRQIVIASDVPPRRLENLMARLVTRFESGFVVRIDDADPTLCQAILERCAREYGVELDPETVQAIVERANGTVRSLLGAWKTVRLHAELEGVAITRTFVEQALAAHAPPETPRKAVQFRDILQAVSDVSGVSAATILGSEGKRLRTRQVTRPRHLVFYLSYTYLKVSYTDIAKLFGGMDHTSVMNGVLRVTNAIAGDGDDPGERWWRQSAAEVISRLGLVE